MRLCQKVELPNGTIVIIAPHPDDEIMGCGGLIQRLTSQGKEIHVVIMTGGEGSHKGCCHISPEQLSSKRRKLAEYIDSGLGIKHIHFLHYPDGGISQQHHETNVLQSLLDQVHPSCAFVPHWGEGWPDHVHAAEIVKSLLPSQVEIYEYCVWLWYYNVWRLDWKHARVLRMSPQEHQKKKQAINDYVTPKAPCGKPWSGVLPKLLLHAVSSQNELFFKVK